MASGFFALLDDIALLADDVAVATKVATKQTVGILGDDIAVSAQQATGFAQERELIVIYKIIKGSLKNKLILLPIILLLSYFIPVVIPYLLIAGAFYLLFEGVEKIEEYIVHKFFNSSHNIKKVEPLTEEQKVKSAIFTDFILSIEIIIMALSTVLDKLFYIQVFSVAFVAVLATFGVYGLVAAIVRIDNLGFYLIKKSYIKSGEFLIALMPKLIKVLSVVGTLAMLLVGGEILIHNIPYIHHHFEATFINAMVVGLAVGSVVVVVMKSFTKIKSSFSPKTH